MSILIGTQGWNYAAWVGPLYPPGTRPSEFLPTYARLFRAVEVDSTFYAVPDARAVRAWAERTPPGFTFALKMPKEVTHDRRLRDADGVSPASARAMQGLLGQQHVDPETLRLQRPLF
jgi:uncharacterized protein YecE (DUF72 family)